MIQVAKDTYINFNSVCSYEKHSVKGILFHYTFVDTELKNNIIHYESETVRDLMIIALNHYFSESNDWLVLPEFNFAVRIKYVSTCYFSYDPKDHGILETNKLHIRLGGNKLCKEFNIKASQIDNYKKIINEKFNIISKLFNDVVQSMGKSLK